MNYCLQNVRIINPDSEQIGDVYIEDGKIIQIKETSQPAQYILMPGWFDPHVHFREPGFEYKEDFASGSRAAIAGGVTSYFDMPNTNPPTFSREILDQKRALASSKSVANFGLYFGAGPENLDEIAQVENVPGVKLYLNTTTGNLKMDDENLWREIFKLGKKVSLHAEGETFQRATEIWLEEDAPCEMHLCHASLASEVSRVRELKDAGHPITMEVCPHHLLMTGKDRAEKGAFCCMKPQLAEEEDLEALWEGVEDGTIDCLATDHAPHTRDEKMEQHPCYGIPGIETLLPLMFTEFNKRNIPLTRLAEMTSHRTAEIFHVSDKKGWIEPGFDADLVLIDPEAEYKINPEDFFSKCDWSPFEGWTVQGKILQTFVNGQLVFDQGKIINEEARGKELQFGIDS